MPPGRRVSKWSIVHVGETDLQAFRAQVEKRIDAENELW